jgi:hypothetical protein
MGEPPAVRSDELSGAGTAILDKDADRPAVLLVVNDGSPDVHLGW